MSIRQFIFNNFIENNNSFTFVDHAMDALSKIFNDIHLKHSEYLYLQTQGFWQTYSEAQAAFMSYIVLQGECQVVITPNTSDGSQKQMVYTLQQGDIALIPSGCAHHCQTPISDLPQNIASKALNPLFNGHQQQPILLGDLNSAAPIDIHQVFHTESAANTPYTTVHEQHPSCCILAVRCHMDTDMAAPLLSTLPALMHLQSAMSTDAPEWLKIGLNFLALETRQHRPGRDRLIDYLVNMLFVECVRDYIEQLPEQATWLSALTHPQLSQALSAIHSHPEEAWTVAKLADQCRMSRSKFAELFSQMVGEPPLSYLLQHRLRLAARYLRDTGLHIHQISLKVGYASETAFSQAFKRQFGTTPSQYRQMHLQLLS